MKSSIMSRRRIIVYVLIMASLTFSFLFIGPIAMSVYSPFAAIVDDLLPSPESSGGRVYVSGNIVYSDGSAAVNVIVHITAMDELISEDIRTDIFGHFRSMNKYLIAQIFRIEVNGHVQTAFPGYDVRPEMYESGTSDVYLGEFTFNSNQTSIFP